MVKIIEHKQGSCEWLAWRRSGIGGSEAPVVMGVSPYATMEQLWLRKMGRMPEQESNQGMLLGHVYEPLIRRKYEETEDIDVFPSCIQHDEHPFLIASLDGLSADGMTILEAKYMNRADFALVRSGLIPAHHYPQLQHQLMCLNRTGAVADYVCYNPNEPEQFLKLRIDPDLEYQKDLFKREKDFWESVEQHTAPVSDRWRDLSRVYAVAKAEEDAATARVKAIEADIEAAFTHEAASGAKTHEAFGLRMTITSVQGRIRYGDLIADQKIGLETVNRFREPSSERTTIKSTRSAVIEPQKVPSKAMVLRDVNASPGSPSYDELASSWTW